MAEASVSQQGEHVQLPALIDRARTRLAEARTSAEVLEGRGMAEAALHYARVTRAANGTHADCLRMIVRAEMRMADEIDRGQASGEVAPPHRQSKASEVPTLSELGVRRDQLHEWRDTRDAGEEVVEGAIQGALSEDRTPSKGDIRKAVEEAKAARRARFQASNAEVAGRGVAAPDQVYNAIVIDPPWPMKKIERDMRPNQADFDYPTMSEEELARFALPAAADCHLFLWTTHKFLPMALRLIEAWGFRYVCAFVWHKPGGFQPIGLPQYNCEFAIYARKGTPTFIETKAFFCCFNAARREHSRKPDEFYEVVRRVTAGPRIDIFSREAREGFDQYGNEADKFGIAS